MSSQTISTFWIETVLGSPDEATSDGPRCADDASADKVFKLSFEGKFYKDELTGTWSSEKKHAGAWPYYGWTVTANEEFAGLGAFMLEAALLSCPSEQLRYNEYDDKAFRFVVKVIA